MSTNNEETLNKTADGSKEAPKKKKKNIIAVMRPQNAASKTVRNIASQTPKKTAEPAPEQTPAAEPAKKKIKVYRKADGTLVTADGRIVKRAPKPADAQQETAAAAEKETAKPAETAPAPEKAAESANTAEPVKAAEAVKPAEAVKEAAPAAEKETAKPVEAAAGKAEAPAKAEEPAKGSAPEKAAEPVKEVAPAKQAQNPARTNNQSSDRPARQSQDRKEYPSRNRDQQGRNSGNRGDRPARDSRPSSDRGQNRNGDRSRTGGAPGRDGRPSFDRNSRPGDNRNGRPAGNGQNRGYAGKDAPEGQNRRPAQQNGQRRNNVSAAPAPDISSKKPGRNIGNKGKDKNKDALRENKFTNDRTPGSSNRPNQSRKQGHNIPKALQKPVHKAVEEKKEEQIKEITIPEKITIKDLADKMKMQPSVIVKKLFLEGKMVTVNQEIEYDEAADIALSFDILAEMEEKVDVIEELLREEEEDPDTLTPRPPVVCVMGHVDHGKTSLLDAIRDTHVTDREAGGITQHIGAYVCEINGQKITFLDTPGHEAFTAMRMRGANSTDIAILVVAADDGVMPQTVEAISHAKAAGVEVIVAINKIDKPGANVDRVKQELMEYELVPEEWGGSTVFVPVSAKTHEGLDNLLEMILLTSEVMELKANKNRKARGLVLEAKLDKGKGPVANVLIQKGTLKVGDYIAAGACSGKVRAMMDEKGRNVKTAGPSTPVEILGLNGVPNAGEIIVSTDSDKEAKNFAATFVSENKSKLVEDTKARMSLDDLFSQIQEGSLKELNIVVKADVQGSVEAMKQSLLKLSNEEVLVKIVHGGVGAINESDVTLAAASNAIVIGFNVRPDATAKTIAEQEGVDMRLYKVIYQAIEDVEAAMKGMLDPIFEEKVIGHGEIRMIFKASGVGNIAGSYVLDGYFQRGCSVRISREGKLIHEGKLASLKRFKDDVKEVKAGFECGLVFEDFDAIEELDQIEAYIMVEVPR